jgi:hypothetical protein
MRWLLRLFPEFRRTLNDLEGVRAAYVDVSQQALRLQDRLDAASQERGQLWRAYQESVKAERAGYQAQINFTAQRNGAPPIYPNATMLDPSALPTEESTRPIVRRELPSEMIARARRKFIQMQTASPEGA